MRYTWTLTAVTAILRTLLENGLAQYGVTAGLGGEASLSALPPDRVKVGADERSQLNLFLYQLTQKGLAPASRYAAEGDSSRPSDAPVLLELLYLISAYGAQDYHAEMLLGYTLEQLNRHAVLEQAAIGRILTALSQPSAGKVTPPPLAALAAPDMTSRIVSLKLCPQIVTSQEMQNLWSTLQAPYRPSATYKVIVELSHAPSDAAHPA